MILVSSCICLCPIYWSQVLSREWRCNWSSADRRCSNYIWVINNLIGYWGAPYIRDVTVIPNETPRADMTCKLTYLLCTTRRKVWCVVGTCHHAIWTRILKSYFVIPNLKSVWILDYHTSACDQSGIWTLSRYRVTFEVLMMKCRLCM